MQLCPKGSLARAREAGLNRATLESRETEIRSRLSEKGREVADGWKGFQGAGFVDEFAGSGVSQYRRDEAEGFFLDFFIAHGIFGRAARAGDVLSESLSASGRDFDGRRPRSRRLE